MNKRTWIGLVIVAVIIAGGVILTIAARSTDRAIKIGAIFPLSGDAAAYGKRARQGVQLAIDEVNASGGINGRMIRVIYEDSAADPKTGVSAFIKLATVDRVNAVIGPMGSSVALAVGPVANSNEIVLLSPTASAPKLTGAGPYFFRNVASDTYDGMAMASFARRELKLKRAGIIYVQNDFGLGLRDSFAEEFRRLDGTVAVSEAFEQGGVDFRAQVTKVAATSPDCVFVVGYKEMGRLLKQCHELGLKTQYLSFSMFEDPDIIKQAGVVANGAYYTFRSYDPTGGDDRVKGFSTRYGQKYGEKPDIFAALSYDAARILCEGLKKAGDEPGDLRDRLAEIKGFPGVTGDTTFDKRGDVVKPMGIKTVRNGEFVWVNRDYSTGGAK